MISLSLTVLGLHRCVRALSSCAERGWPTERGLATVELLLLQSVGSRLAGCSGCCCMQDLPRPGIEPGSPALAGGVLSTPITS